LANTSVLIAVLVYMGWAYDDALYGYFHVRPLDLNVSIVEYMLLSLTLFSPVVVVAAVALVAVATVRTWSLAQQVADAARTWISTVPALRWMVPASDAKQLHIGRLLLIGTGTAITVIALVLAELASHIPINTYILLALLGVGPLLLTWPTRAQPRGRFPYSLALVIAAVCALWAASLHAHSNGIRAAQKLVEHLPSSTAVVVYSVQRLALSGPGVTAQQLPAGFRYHYRYQGLRLLITRADTYYLLPVGWNPQYDLTYVFNESDQIRIELLSGVVRPSS
jgi:hypothetical protein